MKCFHGKLINFTVHSLSYFSSMGRYNFDAGATQLLLLGRRNLGWGDTTYIRIEVQIIAWPYRCTIYSTSYFSSGIMYSVYHFSFLSWWVFSKRNSFTIIPGHGLCTENSQESARDRFVMGINICSYAHWDTEIQGDWTMSVVLPPHNFVDWSFKASHMNSPGVSYAWQARVNDRDFTENGEECRPVGDYENFDVKDKDNL